MTYNQIKESAWKLFENDEVSRRKINNLTKLQNNIEIRSKCLKDYINSADIELTQLNDIRIKADVEKHNTEHKLGISK